MTQAERQATRARAALDRGREHLDRGDPAAAIPWLDTATRYAPDDPTPRLSLAAALLAAGEPAAARAAFRRVGEQVDVREAWLGGALAALRLDATAEAAAMLAHCLSRHRWRGPDAVADAVAARAGQGWCGLREDETLALGGAPGGWSVRVDGRPWPAAAPLPPGSRVAVVRDPAGTAALGSPVDVAAIRRLEGIVAGLDGGLEGWAWHPGDPARDPELVVTDGTHRLALTATDLGMAIPRPLTHPRRFSVAAERLAGFADLLHVAAPDGAALAGSPVPRGLAERTAAERVARAYPLEPGAPSTGPAPAGAPGQQRRDVVVVVPVYRGVEETLACLAAVARIAPPGTAVIVVDDASPEPALAAALDALARAKKIELVRAERNGGFPRAANLGLRAAAALRDSADIVLLNSDTLPTRGWIERLHDAVHAAPDIGTATPLSNNATILGYPDPEAPAPAPSGHALARLGRLAARANPGVRVDIPTAIGFCIYLRRECLVATGLFRDDLFAQGYGEENDFSLRAEERGWRHVAVPGAFVAHVGARSFGAGRAALAQRNAAILERLHPGYAARIEAWRAADPLAAPRSRLDALRWRDAWRGRRAPGETVVLVTHDSGGGVERCVLDRAAAIEAGGGTAILLRPVPDQSAAAAALDRAYRPGPCRARVFGAGADAFPTLTHTLPGQLAELAALLRLARPARMEVHHLLGHDHAVMRLPGLLGIPYDVHVHDYAWFCPRVMLVGAGGRYCGEPALAGCEACIADQGSRLEDGVGVAELRARSRLDLAGATRVVTPSADAARRIGRHFPGVHPQVLQHEADPRALAQGTAPRRARRVAVVGAIGVEKGFDVLLACARDAASRRPGLTFRVVGHTSDDAPLLATGQVSITGPYQEGEAETLIRAQSADLAFIPSVWPETWCFALGEAWRAGLPVAAFDIGAQAERIRATGRGWLLPLGLSARSINDFLAGSSVLAGVPPVGQTSLPARAVGRARARRTGPSERRE